MNKTIKEFEKQCWSHYIDGILVDGHLHFDVKKFAELIINECANLHKEVKLVGLHSENYEQGIWEGLQLYSNQIKKHFGVEVDKNLP